ncbi:hypothetical protein [Telmatospirillum sp. J64-1]|uniref:hypothetical protein n=1 Tax=Telmatospirillum sp. J64-1 TaxID=2502183 RepID=UPI00115F77C5|nr:hypothetical protein [Telmatospirillum sp. J64-1]
MTMKYFVLSAEDYPSQQSESDTLHLVDVLTDVADERWAQDLQWGGPEHDDQHTSLEWRALIGAHTHDLIDGRGNAAPDYRERLVKIAALAVAAIQSHDRTASIINVLGSGPEPIALKEDV